MLSQSDVGMHSIPSNDNIAINPFETERSVPICDFHCSEREKAIPRGLDAWSTGGKQCVVAAKAKIDDSILFNIILQGLSRLPTTLNLVAFSLAR